MQPVTPRDLRLLLGLALPVMNACAPASAQSFPIASIAGTAVAKGEYRPLALDEVTRVTLDGDGRLVAAGSRDSVVLDLPAFVDTTQVVRHWALVTEAHAAGRTVLTFTHDESLDDFTIEVPESHASIRYGAFAHRSGGDVLVLAWGRDERCYWGYVTIAVPTPSASGR